ncbi:hypothetical protein BDV96DRAFT_9122 [Lophiotrema nucula]|uniref:C2H2-type domain-containing protein n=1 Tax=Lophiotrema nucula TaxID=690887 RepID=A0A6A5ZT67_9PLEO|nr:hypothetical protein BDV96DRAFT_9122 [Lophiotrema nucula]
MSAVLEPLKKVKCTYSDCYASFDTEKEMKRHKKYAEQHNYCVKCDKDFDCFDALCDHKAYRPDKHDKACRVCGEEFKSVSGLRRHIELAHKVDQKLPCVGCGQQFHRASLLIEHLEFGYCSEVSAVEFQGHIVHKYLITKLLDDPSAYQRFLQKVSKYDAAVDVDEEGGIDLMSHAEEDYEARELDFEAIKPEESLDMPEAPQEYPSLPSQGRKLGDNIADVISQLGDTTLAEEQSSTKKPWENGKASKTLFPKAKPTPPPSEWSLAHHDQQQEQERGINILYTRFWDPTSNDWNPERFLNPLTNEFYCPFVCEQHYSIPADLNRHILKDHRIATIKCPCCHKEYKSATALVAHCESRGAKCQINKADDFNKFLDRLTGGFLSVEEKIRPDHLKNPSVPIQNPESGRVDIYTPPTATYLQYEASMPAAWKASDARKEALNSGPGVHTIKSSAWTK